MSTPTKSRIPAGDKGTSDRIEADEGGYWVRLVTWQALDREGRVMNHCVGDGDYDHLVGGEEISDNSLWSLRRADGVSVLTVRVRGCELDYARGYSNNEPGRGASMQVAHLAEAFSAAGHRLRVDEDTGIVLLDDGRSFRRDRLPPDVVAAREEAERARMAERAERRRREREAGPGPGAYGGGGGGYSYIVGTPQIMVRPEQGDPWQRIDMRSAERPDRPIIDPSILYGPVHPAFELTAAEEDPIVRVWMLPHELGQRCVTRSGIQFDVSARDVLRAPREAQGRIFLDAYRAAIAQAGQAQESPADGVVHNMLAENIRANDILDLRLPDDSPAWNVRHVEIRAGDILVAPDRYIVDEQAGFIQFLDEHAYVHVRFRAGDRPSELSILSGGITSGIWAAPAPRATGWFASLFHTPPATGIGPGAGGGGPAEGRPA